MKKFIKIIIFFTFLLFYFSTFLSVALASPGAHLELSPSSGIITTTGTPIEIIIDTDGEAAKSAKAVINFNSEGTLLNVDAVDDGDFFDDVSYNIYNTEGQVVINANLSLGSMLESKTGTGTLATMTVKAVGTTGATAAMTFDCTDGSSTDSNINDTTPVDIIVCSENVGGSYTLGAGGDTASPGASAEATTSASTTTTTNGTTTGTGVGGDGTTTTAPVPTTGNLGPTLALLIGGLMLLLLPIFI